MKISLILLAALCSSLAIRCHGLHEEQHSPFTASSLNQTDSTDICAVEVEIGDSWSNNTVSGETFTVSFKISSEKPIKIPWTLVVESPYYVQVSEYWNWNLEEAHDGYLSGSVLLPWEKQDSDHSNVVDLGFIVYTRKRNLEEVLKIPQFISLNGQVCHIYSTE